MDKKIKEIIKHSEVVLKHILAERDKTQSAALKTLLDGEEEAYYSLEENFRKSVMLLGDVQSRIHGEVLDKSSLTPQLIS